MARTIEELCRLLDERGIDYKLRKASGTSARETVYWEYEKDGDWTSAEYVVTVPLEGYGHLSADRLTPEQAIAATLDGGDGGGAVSGVCDSFSGSITGEVLALNPDAILQPDTLYIHMTRGERRIADELRKAFGEFRRVIIDVDGEQHEFSADSLIRLLEGYEGARDTYKYAELFGTPESAAEYFAMQCFGSDGSMCHYCPFDDCDEKLRNSGAYPSVYNALLEWLRGDAEWQE